MKYVRVYESDCYPEEYVTTYLNHCEHVANLQNAGFDFEGCIVKQADTIEELCDEFVVHGSDRNGNRLKPRVRARLQTEPYTVEEIKIIFRPSDYNKPCEIYGAIWTDKGLIYVAKMNEKGELELL